MAANLNVPKPEKCMIKCLDGGGDLTAYFNPKELTVDKTVPWNKHKTSKGDSPTLEFTDAEPRVLTVELFFDTYESRANVYSKFVKVLESYTLVRPDKQRPPMCLFVWGKKFPSFMGVIESLSTKYTMFLSDGTPCRATCTIKMKQAEKLANKNDQGEAAEDYSGQGETVQEGDELRADRLFPQDHRAGLDAAGSEDGRLQPGQQVPTDWT